MVFTFYLIMQHVTIVRADIVRRYSACLPKGAIVTGWGDPYTDASFGRYPIGQTVQVDSED